MSHTLLILKIYTTFKDVQMILKRFYDISTDFRFSKNQCECSVHSCSCPCLDIHKYLLDHKNSKNFWYITVFKVLYLWKQKERKLLGGSRKKKVEEPEIGHLHYVTGKVGRIFISQPNMISNNLTLSHKAKAIDFSVQCRLSFNF